jgi:hypothetical protein
MRGLLLDANIQNQREHLRRLLAEARLAPIFAELRIEITTLAEFGIPLDINDRTLWSRCQEAELVLFTENRNHDGPDSLQATLNDSWIEGRLPVLTLASKQRFERDHDYALAVAEKLRTFCSESARLANS